MTNRNEMTNAVKMINAATTPASCAKGTEMLFTVYTWQFITEQFVPSRTFGTSSEAWAYVEAQIATGKDMSRFRVERSDQPAADWLGLARRRAPRPS